MQIRLSVEVPPAVCEDCYKRVMNEFMKQAKVQFLAFKFLNLHVKIDFVSL